MADTHDHTDKNPVGRRDFFKGAALGAAGLVVTAPAAAAASTPAAGASRRRAPVERAGASRVRRRRRAGARRARRHGHGDAAGVGLHGRRAEEAGPRIRGHQPRLGVRRAARIAAQLRQQHEAGTVDVPARGIGDGDGARLRQGRGQADAGVRPRRRRPAALVDGAVPGVGRPRADRGHRRPSPQSGRRHQPSAQRAGHGVARPRLREVRRRGDDARAVRGVGDAGVPNRDDAAEGAGGARGRRRAAGIAGRRSGAPAHSRR